MSNDEQRGHDSELVRRCLARDQDAWRQLFTEQQPRLLTGLCCRLGPHSDERAEEAASLVWGLLVEGDCRRLRAYDPARGRLCTFLKAVAREALRRLHAESARLPVEFVGALMKKLRARPAPAVVSGLEWEELAATLTRQERRCLDEHLGDVPEVSPLSEVNRRVLRWRLRHKLESFLRDA